VHKQGRNFKSDERILGDSDFVESVLREQKEAPKWRRSMISASKANESDKIMGDPPSLPFSITMENCLDNFPLKGNIVENPNQRKNPWTV
jgi:hypothetical protein